MPRPKRAEAALARLLKLRGAAEAAGADDTEDAERRPAKWARKRLRFGRLRRPRWLRRPGRKTIAAGVGIVLAFTSLAASGYMLWQHRIAVHNRHLAAEFSAAARQGVTALMSIDPDHAREDVQRSIDASTGDQKNQLSVLSPLIVNKAQETKVGTKVTIEAVAVESLSDNSGVVLVAAKPFPPDRITPNRHRPCFGSASTWTATTANSRCRRLISCDDRGTWLVAERHRQAG